MRAVALPSSVRVLGTCGLVAALLATGAGFFDLPILLGLSGAIMVAGNLYAMVKS